MTNKRKLNRAINNFKKFKDQCHLLSKEERKENLNNILLQIKEVVHDQKKFEKYQEIIHNHFAIIVP